MRIIDVPDTLAARILTQLEDFESIAPSLRRIEKIVRRIEGQEIQEAIDLAALTEKVTAGTALDQSIKTLVEGIAAELETSSDPAVVALAAQFRAQATALAAAVTANTV